MNDRSNKRASFIGSKLRSLRSLVNPSGKTSTSTNGVSVSTSHTGINPSSSSNNNTGTTTTNNNITNNNGNSSSNNNNNSTTNITANINFKSNEVPSSITPNKTKKKVRSRTNSKRNLNVMSDLDDIHSPSVRAQQQQQLQRQLSHKQVSVASAVKPNSNHKSTGTIPELSPLNMSSTGGMRQRLLEIEEMIARGKEEMGMLQAAEAVKIQAVARGFLQRRRLEKIKLAAVTNTTTTTTTTKAPTSNKKQQTTTAATTNPNPTKKKRKRAPNKTNSKDATNTSANKETAATKKVPRKELKTASAIKIQALVRGYLSRRTQHQPKTPTIKKNSLNRKTSASSNKGSKKLEKKTSDGSSGMPTPSANNNNNNSKEDHYAWDADKNSPDNNDHYAWERNAASASKVTATNTTQSARRGSKTALASGKAKAKRLSGIRIKDQSVKDHSLRDQSMKEESIPFHELVVDPTKKESSGSIGLDMGGASSNTIPVVVEDEEVFEDADDESQKEPSLLSSERSSIKSQQSFQMSVAGSFLSKLTEDEEDEYDGLELGSITSNEADGESDAEDMLSISIMATAPKKQHAPLELMNFGTKPTLDAHKHNRRRQDDRREHKTKTSKHQQHHQEDDNSVSVMALSPRSGHGSDDDSIEQDEGVDEALEEDGSEDSRASYAYVPRYNRKSKDRKSSRRNRHVDEDDLSVSVMAVAEVSDLEGESAYEHENELDESEYEDYDHDDDEDGSADEADDLSDSVMAVALPGESCFDGDENDSEDGSVFHNAREDDMSITSVETDLPRETSRRDRRRRRRRQEYDEVDDDDVIEAEDVSVLTTASHKRQKKNHHHNNNNRHRTNKQSERKKSTNRGKSSFGNQNLLGQFQYDTSEEDTSKQYRKRRQRRNSRRSTSSKNNRNKKQMTQNTLPTEEELQRKLEEVNRLIDESRKEMERIMEEEVIKIQAFVRMHQERKIMGSSGFNLRGIRQALSRTGTKSMNIAATTIQTSVRSYQARSLVNKMRRSRKFTRKNRKRVQEQRKDQQRLADEELLRRRRDDARQMAIAMEEAKLSKQLQEEAQRQKAALEASKASKLQARVRGFLVRSKDLLNPERLAAIKIQRFVRSALRVIQLRNKLNAISIEKENQLKMVQEYKLRTIEEFEPGKFDNMDTRVKMVNFLKKQIEKENEITEKLIIKVKAVKENNVRLVSENSTTVCTLTRLQLDVEAREEKKNSLLKLNQEWIDGIKEYQSRLEAVNRDIKMQQWHRDINKEYCKRIARLVESRNAPKKLVKEVKFLADHSELAGGNASSERLE